MTQVVSPSGRSRHDMDRRHAAPHHAVAASGWRGAGRGRHATTQGQGFNRVIGWTILGAVIPGSGLIASGRRGLGGFVLTIAALLAGGAFLAALVVDPLALARKLVSDPNNFTYIALGLAVLLLSWATVVVATHSATRRFSHLTGGQRLLASLLVTSLIGVVAVPTAKAAHDALIARDVLTTLFKNGNSPLSKDSKGPDSTKADPWAGTPRVNVLLLGSDSGADRIGVRPDTMIVASINTVTGDTVLVSLPRNLQHVPFPAGTPQAAAYPNGFYCYNAAAQTNTECLLNALWTWGEANKNVYYQGDAHPGLTATVQGIQELTGLTIDDYAMLNLRGFAEFINAMGGITVNVTERLPIGPKGRPTEWIPVGKHKLDGYHALWYARSRATTSDFDRMRRQRCVIGAVVQQANPVQLAIAFPQIAKAMKTNLQTSIPLQDINAWVVLSQRVKKAQVRSLAFTDQVINTVHPDVDKMHRLVEEALNPPAKTPSPSASASTGSSPSPTKSTTKTTKSATRVDSTTAQDVKSVC